MNHKYVFDNKKLLKDLDYENNDDSDPKKYFVFIRTSFYTSLDDAVIKSLGIE